MVAKNEPQKESEPKKISSYEIERALLSTAYFQLKETTKKLEESKEALGRSEERFRRLAENARDVIYRMSLPDGKYEYMSPAALQVFGYAPEEFYKTPLLVNQIIHPDWHAYFEEQWVKLIKGEVPPTYEYQIIHRSGEIRWMNQRNILVRDNTGNPIAIEGIVTDVTEHKREEELLYESEEKFAAAFKSSPNLIAITKFSDGTIIEVNEGYTQLLGYSREESIGKTTAELSIWANSADRAIFVDGLAKNGQIANFETVLRRKNGTVVNVIDSARTIEIGGEKCVLSVAYDITERKRTEEELSKLKKAVDNSGEAIFMTDRDGIITFINPGFTKLYGYAVEEVIGKETPRILKSGLRKPDEYVMLWKNLLAGQVVKDEHINKTKDGRLVTVNSSANPIFDEQGVVVGFLAIQSDISDRKQAEERLRELDVLKDKFIQTVSHQMRTPLSVIRWQLENLLEGEHGKLNEYQEQLAQSCYQADLEVITRINDFVTALEIEEGRMPRLDKTPNCLENLWKSVEIKFSKDCGLKKIAYKSNLPEISSPLIEIDIEKIRFVMEKLAENALTYTNEGGSITVTIKQVDASVRFEIADTGVGIPKLEQAHIFTRFYRASNASAMKPDASGLGLFIAKHFVEAHDGTIGFTSEEGKGSTFWFELSQQPNVG